ncbi:hypothetical protein [Lentzea flaviverrucosa]|nr:hypothetical protein [Lentzea flaviverrucosa]
MRIALVTSHIGRTSRGTVVTGLARALVHGGHDAVVYTRRDAT